MYGDSTSVSGQDFFEHAQNLENSEGDVESVYMDTEYSYGIE